MPIPGFVKGPTLPGCAAGRAPAATVPGQLAALTHSHDDLGTNPKRKSAAKAKRRTKAKTRRGTKAKTKRGTKVGPEPGQQRARTIRQRRTDAASELADLLSASLTLGAPEIDSDGLAALLGDLELGRKRGG